MMGQAILRPGLLRRGDALAAAARRAVRLLFGCMALLVVAGTIEGFVSPSDLPAWAKFGLGALSGLALYGYLLLAGRRDNGRH